jgi:hypothetical protein
MNNGIENIENLLIEQKKGMLLQIKIKFSENSRISNKKLTTSKS